MSELLAQSLSLPCGARLRNRLAKAAMTEGLENCIKNMNKGTYYYY